MAAERMPDFEEINTLIESLQKLDRSFQRIISEYDQREESVRRECREALKKQSAQFLQEIPVEELKNSKAGIRTGVLEKAGCEILRFSEIGTNGYPEPVVRDVLQHLIVRGVISRVGDDIYAMTHYMDDVEAKIRAYFETADLITFVQIKEMFGTSRKSAKFLAEYMDMRKVTKKVGAETERVPYR